MRKHPRTRTHPVGKPVTDEEIETLAAKPEVGYDVESLLARRGSAAGRRWVRRRRASSRSGWTPRDQLFERAKVEGHHDFRADS